MQAINVVLLLVVSTHAMGADPSGDASVSYYCNAKTSSFFIIAEDSEVSWPKGMRPNRSIQWSSLLKWGPQTNGSGDPLRTGSLVVNRQCGKLNIRFEGGYLNDNLQGQDGALEFPVIELTIDKRLVLPRTAIAECDASDTRTAYFGPCPSEWAQSIQAVTKPVDKVNVTIKRKFVDDGDVQQETVEVIEK